MLKYKYITLFVVGLFCMVTLAIIQTQWPWQLLIIPLLIWLVFVSIGSFHIRLNFFLKGLHSNHASVNPTISLTFDDGPDITWTPKVLDLLKKYNAKATFFVIGSQVQKYPELVKRIIEEGHELGNHTYSHSETFGFKTREKVEQELVKTNEVVKNVTGKKLNLYRPAFGVTNPRIASVVTKLNLLVIGWSVRSLDTKNSKEKVLTKLKKSIQKGDIVLLHDTSDKTVQILTQLLIFLETKKLKSVPVSTLLNVNAYV